VGLNARGVAKYSDFGPSERCIYIVLYELSIGTTFGDLE